MWTKDKILGTGGFGIVTLWHNSENGSKIALKKCRWIGDSGNAEENLLTTKHIERWEKEVEIMNRLDHNAVVKCFPVPPELRENSPVLPMLCMEYCSGGDLRKVLNRPENCCGLSEVEARSCLRDMTEAISYLHSLRIIHRDLKPENIVLQDVESQVRYKLIDLGYAKELEHGSVCTSFVGTLQYLAPELFLSKRYSCTVDYWSIGLVTHEIVTGLRPFLPNMSPVEWMKKVKSKKPEHICVFENRAAEVEFSSKIFSETQISGAFRCQIEDWLRIMLEWDPVRRGHITNESGVQQLVAFSKISEILNKKIMKVFVVETCEVLEYEVDESRSVSDVMNWVQRDANVSVTDQLPLLPRGQTPDPSASATQCWAPPGEDEWMLFVFSDTTTRPHVPPHFPPLVEEMLRHSKVQFDYRTQRRMWAHSLFFLKREARLLTLLSQAQRISMMHLMSSHSKLVKDGQKMLSSIAKLQARHDLFIESLNADLNMYENQANFGISSQKLYRSWREMGEMSLHQLRALTDRTQQIEGSLTVLSTKVLEIQCSPYSRENIESFNSIKTAGEDLYSAIRKMSREARTKDSDNTEMCKLLVQALRKRDRLHKAIYKQLEKQHECVNEMVGLSPPVESVLHEAARLAQNIFSLQMKRQADIWKIMEIALQFNRGNSTNSSQGESVTAAPIPLTTPTSKPAAATFEISALDSKLENSSKTARALINENRHLRAQMMDLLTVMIPSTLNIGLDVKPELTL